MVPDNRILEPTIIHASHIAVCTGLHVVPAIPEIPGIEHVLNPPTPLAPGTPKPAAYHSAEYKLRSQLTGRKVLILGTGETGMDLAYEAAKGGAKEVVLCSRAG
jgi:dimethylaniline monooxygenase (N-oxide forming)